MGGDYSCGYSYCYSYLGDLAIPGRQILTTYIIFPLKMPLNKKRPGKTRAFFVV